MFYDFGTIWASSLGAKWNNMNLEGEKSYPNPIILRIREDPTNTIILLQFRSLILILRISMKEERDTEMSRMQFIWSSKRFYY